MSENVITYRHSVNSGDLICALAGMRAIWKKYGKKAVIYQEFNRAGNYYPGAVHPVKNEFGEQVCMNQKQFDQLRPLILAQAYVEDMQEFTGQKVAVDLDKIRSEIYVGMPNLMIASWTLFGFPDMGCDLSKPWIRVPYDPDDLCKDKIIVNFTERYRNNTVHYFFLKEHRDELIFAGTEEEHMLFNKKWHLDLPRLQVANFLELATHILCCRFFMGNQSMCWNIANALGSPRILEVSSMAPNCQPFVGPHNYGYFHQGGLEYYFHALKEEIS